MAIWEGYEDHEEADPMIELELLGANGDVVVMTDARGQRYSIVVDDALRAAVRRDRPAALPQPADLNLSDYLLFLLRVIHLLYYV